MASSDTPLMRQYSEVKSRHKDALLLFRMGDFYELFHDDALVAAKALDIALTSRNKNDPNPVPMCGVPHHSATNYIHRLVAQGFKVAICEQLEDPTEAKGIVKRDVIRVVSPGTRLDPEALDSKAPNFTHAAAPLPTGGIAWATCDFTTGRTWFGEFASELEWLAYARGQSIAEAIFPDKPEGERLLARWKEELRGVFCQTAPSFYFEPANATDRLREQFGVTQLSAVHPTATAATLSPMGALVKYFQETQKASRIPSVVKLELWGSDDAMELDGSTVRALDLLPARETTRDVSLLSWLDRTKTAMGARLLRERLLRPLLKPEAINARLDEASELRESFKELGPCLNEIYDFERLISRIGLGPAAAANARDLRALAFSVAKAEELATKLGGLGASGVARLRGELERALTDDLRVAAREALTNLEDPAPATVREGGIFRRGTHPQLDELIELSTHGENWLAEFEARERRATGIASLKVRFNRVFGYYIEVTKANLASAPAHYVRKQTMVGGERFITEELKAFEEKILTAEKRRSDMEYALFREMCGRFAALSAPISALARAVAAIDVSCSAASLAGEEGYTRPVVDSSAELEIVEGRHPTVSQALARQGAAFVPNSVKLGGRTRFLLVTGPNMGGKSTVMRQTALIALLAQVGSYVPARSARVGCVDRIFTRIGSSDNLAEGASTFMVEMSEMSFILRQATDRSLILIDEVGRGTSTYDGMSLAWALAIDICERVRARAMFATHYHELTALASNHASVDNARVAVALETGRDGRQTPRFLYRLEPGVAERSYGIQVARLAGLPEDVLSAASEMLARLEAGAAAPAASSRASRDQLALELRAAPRKAPESARPPESAVENWLKTLPLTELTPLQALVQLAEWKEKLASSPAAR
jgi:DNA mismatch repair protein MutS